MKGQGDGVDGVGVVAQAEVQREGGRGGIGERGMRQVEAGVDEAVRDLRGSGKGGVDRERLDEVEVGAV